MPVPRKLIYETFPLFPVGPPTSLEIPTALIEERKYFPNMIHFQRQRALKIYLLLLYMAAARKSLRFQFSPEAAGEFLGILPGEGRSAIRRQIIRVLRDLENLDGLLKTKFLHGRETQVELFLPAGPLFVVGSDELEVGEMAVLDDNQIFFRLVRSRLGREGKRLEDLNQIEIKRRFFIAPDTTARTLGPSPRRGRPPVKSKKETSVSSR